jgi:hypothetical protein
MTFLKTSGLYCVQLFIQTATQKERIVVANLLTSVNSLNKKIIKILLPGAAEHPATLISRQHSLSAGSHRNSPSAIINRHQKMSENAEIQ